MKLIRVLSNVVLLTLLSATSLWGDAIITHDATKFGHIVSFDTTNVLLNSGCDAKNPESVPWSGILLLKFDNQCTSHSVLLNPAGLQKCSQPRRHGLKVEFSHSKPMFALSGTLRPDGKIQFVLMVDESLSTGLRKYVKSIQPVEVCPSSLSDKQVGPKEFCSEPKQWAVNWSPTPVFNNQIFTKGASIYLEVIGKLEGVSEEDVRFAYQSALSIWAIAIQDARDSLPPEFQKYVADSTASGGKYKLFTPPQVIRMMCPNSALSIVKWYAERRNAFPRTMKDYIAMAQVQGRTILLNANDNLFVVARNDLPLPENQVSLISVFIHELGHSFGLPDRAHTGEASVMDPAYVTNNLSNTLRPSSLDTRDFANLLGQSIQGAAPGVFRAKQCAGLRWHHT